MQLTINLNFPFGRFHGREFPPSPTRFFQALIAGTNRGIYEKQNEGVRNAAFEWLEKLAPPTIITCRFTESGKGTNNFVPNNDNGREPNKYNQTARFPWLHEKSATKSMQAFVFHEENAIRFVWDFSDDAENKRNAEVICKMARLVTHLGHGQDAVFARGEIVENNVVETEKADESRIVFRPKLHDGGEWTVPTAGALASYRRRYQRFLETGNSHTARAAVRQVEYVSDETIDLSCPYALFEIQRLDADEKFYDFDGRKLRKCAATVRHEANKIFYPLKKTSERDIKKADNFRNFYTEDLILRKVLGHKPSAGEERNQSVNEQHLAFLPLPHLYPPHPSGDIHRVLLAGFGFSESEEDLFNDVAGNLNGAELKDIEKRKPNEEEGEPIARLIKIENHYDNKFFNQFYSESARVWRSVTPVVLSGFNRRGRKPEQLLYRALNQIGIETDAIESVAVFRSPIVPKTFRPMDYKIAPNDYLNESPRYHAEIIFKRPVRGVLVVGRGRHAGFGLMMPVE